MAKKVYHWQKMVNIKILKFQGVDKMRKNGYNDRRNKRTERMVRVDGKSIA